MRTIIGRIVLASLCVTALPAHAATSSELLRCQKGLHSRAAGFEKVAHLRLSTCALKVETCQLIQEIDGDDVTTCLASAASACSAYSAKVSKYKSTYRNKALSLCATAPLVELEQSIGGLGLIGVGASCGATTVVDLVYCVFDAVQCSAERTLFALDPRAQNAFTAAGIAAAHPCAAP